MPNIGIIKIYFVFLKDYLSFIGLPAGVDLTNMFTQSSHKCRSQKSQKDSQVISVLMRLLGSAHSKAVRKKLMKLTQGRPLNRMSSE